MEGKEDEKPRRRKAYRRVWSIRHDTLSDFELSEYRRTGTVRIKEPVVFPEDRRRWPYGCYRNINIKEMLGGEELLSWDPDVELEIISRVYMTEYGIIGVEDTGSTYLLDVVDRSQRRSVLRDLEWNGCRARITTGGHISVFKEELIYD